MEAVQSLECSREGPRRMGRGTYRWSRRGTGEALPDPVPGGFAARAWRPITVDRRKWIAGRVGVGAAVVPVEPGGQHNRRRWLRRGC
jgi:hypothetical protein